MNKFFSFLAGMLFFASLHTSAIDYGICILNFDPTKLEEIETIVEQELSFIGIQIQEPNVPVFGVKNYAEAENIKALLEQNAYVVTIIEVRYDDEPNATVLSAAAIEGLMQSMEPLLDSLEGVENLDEARARLTEILEKELATA
ncbi:MAG: hypothetical protein M1114_00515 [Candidatus Dependentiae bacterium]|nr:hypothetical protein [Candidatus Dependentiae bacterium]